MICTSFGASNTGFRLELPMYRCWSWMNRLCLKARIISFVHGFPYVSYISISILNMEYYFYKIKMSRTDPPSQKKKKHRKKSSTFLIWTDLLKRPVINLHSWVYKRKLFPYQGFHFKHLHANIWDYFSTWHFLFSVNAIDSLTTGCL